MYILGLNLQSLDVSASLLKDGQLVCMVEQERLSRHKKAKGEQPTDAILACLKFAHITLDDIAAIAIGWDIPNLLQVKEEPYNEQLFLEQIFQAEVFPQTNLPPLYMVPHHTAHAASGFWTSGMERAAIVIADGMAETQSTSLAIGTATGIQIETEWPIAQSMGNFYSTACQWVGLGEWGTGKLMGLASYGQPCQISPLTITDNGYTFLDTPPPHSNVNKQIIQQLKHLTKYFKKQNYPFCPGDGQEIMAYANFAASIQKSLEDVMLHLSRIACEKAGTDNLILVGGVAMNCSMNGKIVRSGLFKEVYIPPIPFDAGVSLGAALHIYHKLINDICIPPRMKHAYWTPPLQEEEILQALTACGLPFQRLDENALLERVTDHLIAGHIIGWAQGRAEIGQRALGARSILGDPRRREMLIRINQVKGREVWRPLAPSVLEEFTDDIFGATLPSPGDFMLAAWPVRPDVQRKIPAVVHVDGTARPQVVRKSTNPRYWELINMFREKTTVPLLINTSFNLAGEPIVYNAVDAISTFCRSEIEVLVLDNYLVEKIQ